MHGKHLRRRGQWWHYYRIQPNDILVGLDSASTSMYAVALQEAVKSDSLERMRLLEKEAEIFLKQAEVVKGELQKLDSKLK